MKFCFLLILLFAACPAWAEDQATKPSVEEELRQEIENNHYKNYLSFSFENDSIGGGSDENYTSGVRFSWYNVNAEVPQLVDDIAGYVPTFDINKTTSVFYSFGQNLYTPENIKIAAPQPGGRPWAAWLYGSIGLATVTKNHKDELELTLGVVGPPALGEPTQKFIHRHITDSDTPKGWAHQLNFEPGIILSWTRRWPRAAGLKVDDFLLSIEPNVTASLGNIYTYAGAGLTATFGPYQDRLQDTPPRVRPAMPGTGYFRTPDQRWSWYLFASADGRAVARNIFLDGNSFDDDPSVSKKPLTGDLSGGIAFTLGDYRLSYAVNMRSKEYDGQDSESVFGSMTLTTRF